MQEFIDSFIYNIVYYLQVFGIAFGFLIIYLESIIPALPLGVFIAFNMMAFGTTVGFLLSWVATIIGCLSSYCFFKHFIGKKLDRKIDQRPKVAKIIKVVKSISFSRLVLITALPFSPAFLINIACGIAKIDFKKFLSAMIIGKISIIYFWGFISKSLLESITDIPTLLIVSGLLLGSYFASKLINKKLHLD